MGEEKLSVAEVEDQIADYREECHRQVQEMLEDHQNRILDLESDHRFGLVELYIRLEKARVREEAATPPSPARPATTPPAESPAHTPCISET
uniref:Uncharacterized protein n=1 Tax=viral metagenome TaxID=1070528 RepID=A0A6M3LXJ7_9ZZZZ